MENWGLVTFRETALLLDGPPVSIYAQRRVAAVVAHEMAHLWFGDLVTMEWWNDLWCALSTAHSVLTHGRKRGSLGLRRSLEVFRPEAP